MSAAWRAIGLTDARVSASFRYGGLTCFWDWMKTNHFSGSLAQSVCFPGMERINGKVPLCKIRLVANCLQLAFNYDWMRFGALATSLYILLDKDTWEPGCLTVSPFSLVWPWGFVVWFFVCLFLLFVCLCLLAKLGTYCVLGPNYGTYLQ